MRILELEATTGVAVLDHLDKELSIPVVSGAQRQGDVIIIPVEYEHDGAAIPQEGIPVVRGENGGNTHLLLGDGTFSATLLGTTLGYLTVPDGGVAVLAHPEHGFNQVGAGTYRVGRQREQADQIRVVAD